VSASRQGALPLGVPASDPPFSGTPAGTAAARAAAAPALSTGHSALDACLPGGGWPLGALVELMPARAGIGELSLLLPALARLARGRRWLVWVAPPWIPYAPALATAGVDPARVLLVHPRTPGERLWAAVQAARSPAAAAVLAWLPAALPPVALRRLQLAAAGGDRLAVLFRPPAAADRPSPAAVRIRLAPEGAERLRLEVLKRRGGWPTRLTLPRPAPCA